MPADLDIASTKTVEAVGFDWPESLARERIQMGIAEIVAAILVFAGFVILAVAAILVFAGSVILARGTISCLLPFVGKH